MKIVSKFHDYYDSLLNLYVDEKNPVWIRNEIVEETKIPFDGMIGSFFNKNFNDIYPVCTSSGVIVFCGTAYPYFIVEVDTGEPLPTTTWRNITKNIIVFDKQELIDLECEFLLKQSDWYVKRVFSKSKVTKSVDAYYADVQGYDWDKSHKEYNSPVLLFKNKRYDVNLKNKSNSVLVVNPKLSDFNFAKIIDPYSAIQKIDMYLNNQLASDKMTPIEVSDKVMQHSKGFDHKYSFKKEPTKKK